MAEPTPPNSVLEPASIKTAKGTLVASASLILVLEFALGLRVLAANLIDQHIQRGGANQLCLFPDTRNYWELACRIRAGALYEIMEWSDIPHFALRTPGYPLFLATCQVIFGERTLAVRLVQAVLGTVSVYLVYLLTQRLITISKPAVVISPHYLTAPLTAAALAALNPCYIIISSFVLSEAVFEPLMLSALLGLVILWDETGRLSLTRHWRVRWIALASGAAAGAAILVRPSWGLFVSVLLGIWAVAKLHDRECRATAIRSALIYAIGVALVMGPWWIHNARIYGRFVPTAVWLGASLYDGLNPGATGASNMAFLGDRDIWPLGEQDQDAELTQRVAAFARDQPLRVLELAIVKLGRYWSPWPNAEGFRSPFLAVASAIVELPLFGLLVVGALDRRRDPRALLLLAGPVLYFCALHMVFASSMRYRIPGEMPALGLAAIGCVKTGARWRSPKP